MKIFCLSAIATILFVMDFYLNAVNPVFVNEWSLWDLITVIMFVPVLAGMVVVGENERRRIK